MDSLQRFGWLTNSMIKSPLQIAPFCNVSWKPVFIQHSSVRPVRSEIGERDDVLETFLRERESSGDLVSRVSDMMWRRNALSNVAQQDEVMEDEDDDDGDGSAARNRKALEEERERRKKVNLLEYEAIKRELRVLCIAIGSACTLYCATVVSLKAGVSYAVGVGFSWLYLELLCNHADSVSREGVPPIFRRRERARKIGIRSEDLRDGLERTVKGSAMALSSPRLLIPAAIYAVSGLFHLEIAPALLGMFVYKAAALVQVYRDNQDLQFVFPDDPFS